MEIIRRGTPAGERTWIGTCRSCGSKARAKQSELKNIDAGDYRSEGPFSWEVCPVCEAGDNPRHAYGGMLFYPETSSNEKED